MLNLEKNKKYLLGCSFGPDSMALFDILEKDDINFDVAIVNYHLRKESNDEVNGLKKYCSIHEKDLQILNVLPNQIKGNVEECCRKIRYKWFAKLCKENKYDAILIAHNQDDLIETYLLQSKRRSIVEFYGLKSKILLNSVEVIRPLLGYSKKDLREYCDSNSIPYAIDSSNLTDAYERNKIRHKIVEKLSNKERIDFLDLINEKNKELGLAQLNSKKAGNNLDNVLNLSELEFCLYINENFKNIGFSNGISKRRCHEIRKILISKKPNVILSLGRDAFFIKSYDKVYFEKVTDFKYEYKIDKPCELDTPYFYLNFKNDSSNRNVKNYPIFVRNANKDDTYRIKNYFKKVNRLFIDWKMPIILRKRWPVICDSNNKVIYVPRYKSDFVIDKNINFYVK